MSDHSRSARSDDPREHGELIHEKGAWLLLGLLEMPHFDADYCAAVIDVLAARGALQIIVTPYVTGSNPERYVPLEMVLRLAGLTELPQWIRREVAERKRRARGIGEDRSVGSDDGDHDEVSGDDGSG